jgi:hypothetical protein
MFKNMPGNKMTCHILHLCRNINLVKYFGGCGHWLRDTKYDFLQILILSLYFADISREECHGGGHWG